MCDARGQNPLLDIVAEVVKGEIHVGRIVPNRTTFIGHLSAWEIRLNSIAK